MTHEWLYYVLYPGSPHKLDAVVEDLIRPAVATVRAFDVAGWFFLRYADELGAHLRFRVLAPRAVADALDPALRSFFDDALERIAGRPSMATPRSWWEPLGMAGGSHVGCELGVYEPELEKYGGPAGVRRAERVFEASSELALSVLSPSMNENDRRAVALAVMTAGARWSVSPHAWTAFWQAYAWHWSGGDRAGADRLRARYAAAAVARAPVARRRIEELSSDADFARTVGGYLQALNQCWSEGAQDGSQLFFHFCHLMNNRLGIPPAEEAYLASLLLALEGTDAPSPPTTALAAEPRSEAAEGVGFDPTMGRIRNGSRDREPAGRWPTPPGPIAQATGLQA